MSRNKVTQFASFVAGLLLTCGLGLSSNPAKAVEKEGVFNTQWTSGPLEGQSLIGEFKYDDSFLLLEQFQTIRINEGLLFLKFVYEGQTVTHEAALNYPEYPQIQFFGDSPQFLEFHLAEGVVSISSDVILTVDFSTNYGNNSSVNYSLKDENTGLILLGEGVTDIQVLGGFIGLGALVLVSINLISLLKEERFKKSTKLEGCEENDLVFRIC